MSVENTFEGKLSVFFQEYLIFYDEMCGLNGRKQNFGRIYALLQIYPTLTQTQLQNLTGYSKTHISNILKQMKDQKLLKSQRIGKSRQFEYSVYVPTFFFDYTNQNQKLDFFPKTKQELHEFFHQLDRVRKKKGATILRRNIEDFYSYFDFYQRTERKEVFNVTKCEIRNTSLNPVFDPKIEEIETQFLNYFLKYEVFDEMNETNARIFAYFITRNNLTLSELARLSKTSMTTVSKYVKYLEKVLLIEANPSSHGYHLKSFGFNWLRNRIYYLDQIFKWRTRFQEILELLHDPDKNFFFLQGYAQIFTLVSRILKTSEFFVERSKKVQPMREFIFNYSS
ncbi:hypothetical protein [Candidatus Lokiarchaeum ossiferum]|uniref:hypothetical protein n=1 Tax=Candidatus Lokiarchaeum ossiferum TaxID=2951803 RepID=UPI00352F6F4C